jgi:type I restriction enzyme S subunit
VREDWQSVRLGDVADLTGGYAFKSTQYTDKGRFVLRTVNIRDDFSITREGATFISEQEAQEYSRFDLQDKDTLFVMVAATLGKVGYVSSEALPALLNQNMWVIRAKPGEIEPDFLQFCFRELSKIPLAWVSGSARSFLRRDDVRNLEFLLPSLPERRAIAATLGALDDKIELNRKMNATLEAMARALFRDWFVDFGPTRAKMAGAAPYLSPDLWSLFPDRLDDAGKPEGWEERPLDEIADFLNGLALQKFPGETEPDSLPVIKIAELRNGISGNSNRASRKVPLKYVIQDGDFLFSWSGSLLAKFWIGGEGALNQHLFKVSSTRYPAWFFSEWVQHHLEEFQIIAASKATTMGHIQRGHLKAAKTICPPDDVIQKMGDLMAPLINRTIRNELESRTLAQTRDLLLPRLMSGELRVTDTAETETV